MDSIRDLRRILGSCRTIAVVGLSPQWHRPSFFAAKYMQAHGYRIVPVNPSAPEILGERSYASVTAAAKALADEGLKIDMVDCFRKTEDILPIADEAIGIGARGRAGHRDGPLREDRACPPFRRSRLGRREHQGHFVAQATEPSLLNPSAV